MPFWTKAGSGETADPDVVIRLVTRDHAAQAARAAENFRSGRVLIPKTVMR